MKKIRKGTFETNSNSMHSPVIEGMEKTKEFNPKVDKNGYYHMNLSNYIYNIVGVSKDEYYRYYLTCFL